MEVIKKQPKWVIKTINITPKQEQHLIDQNINLSATVRKWLDQNIKESKA